MSGSTKILTSNSELSKKQDAISDPKSGVMNYWTKNTAEIKVWGSQEIQTQLICANYLFLFGIAHIVRYKI